MLSDVYEYNQALFRYDYNNYRVEYLDDNGNVLHDTMLTPSRWENEKSRKAFVSSWLFVMDADGEAYLEHLIKERGAC